MYIAVNYIGTDFTPGEVLPDSLDEALVKRLLKTGAIREESIVPSSPIPTPDLSDPEMTEEEKLEMVRQNYYAQLAALGYAPDGMTPITAKAEADAGNGDDADDEDTEDEVEPEPPEVDVSAALVQESKETKPKATDKKKGGQGK